LKRLLLLGVLAASSWPVSAETPFMDPRFSVTVTPDVVYGTAPIGAPEPGQMELLLDLYEPEGPNAPDLRPAVLVIHGGGFRSGDKASGRFVALCRDLTARGYVCASINYRLEGDDPPTQGDDPRQRAISAAIEDAGTALRWLHDHAAVYGIDGGRVAVGGGSAGAITSLFVVYRVGDPLSPVGAVLDLWGGLYDSVDAIEAGDPPLIIIHGTEDQTVPFSLAEDLVRRADEVGVPYELWAIEGAGHGVDLRLVVDGVTLYDRIADFFYRHLDLAGLPGPGPPRSRIRRADGWVH
jgi:acetyl esterase/lipase